MKPITIHFEPRVEWQRRRVDAMREGLHALGYTVQVTSLRKRVTPDPAILFGTTFFKDIEAQEGDWLLVDRCSFGDTTQQVSLVWNGHGRRGDHRVPSDWRERDSRLALQPYPFEITDCHDPEGPVVLCGQESAYSPDWELADFYDHAYHKLGATHWRPHPAVNDNPLNLPVCHDWNVRSAITLNSTVVMEYLRRSIPVHALDMGSMAREANRYTRQEFFEWLAWTQWTWDEISEGLPIQHVFDQGH